MYPSFRKPYGITGLYKSLFLGEKAVILEKSRQSRLHLRKFLKSVKQSNPDASCSLDNEKLVIDGKVFVYSETVGKVVNMNTENSDEVSIVESEHDRYNQFASFKISICILSSQSESSRESQGTELTLWETYQWRNRWKEIREKEELEKKDGNNG